MLLTDFRGLTEAIDQPVHRFVKDILRYAPARLVPALAALAGALVFTRVFSTSDYGAYSLAMSVVAPVLVVITEWASQPLGRFFSEFELQGNLQAYRSALGTLMTIVGIAGCIACISLAISLKHLVGGALGLGAAALLLAQSLYSLLLPIVPASLDHRTYQILEIGRPLLQLAFSLGLIRLFGAHPSLLIFGAALGLVPLLPLLVRRVSSRVGGRIQLFQVAPAIGRLARYGIPMMGWFFAAQLLGVGDRYVLQAFRGSAEVGIYSANYNLITGAAGLLGAPITLAAFPIVMYMWSAGRREDIRRTIASMTEWYLILGIGMLGITVTTARGLISLLLGPAFREGYTVLAPVLAGQILWQASILGHKGMELMECTQVMLKWSCVAALANIGLNILLVPHYGYLAAAYTTLLSYGLYAFLIWRSSKQYLVWDIPFKSIGLILLFASTGLAVARLAGMGRGFWQSPIETVIFISIYGISTGLLKRREIRAVWNMGKDDAVSP